MQCTVGPRFGARPSRLSRSEAIYFSTTVLSTVGFGDSSAVSDTARLLVTAQTIIDVLVLGVGVTVLTGAAKLGRERRTANTRTAGGDDDEGTQTRPVAPTPPAGNPR